jgi:hypothetical protein
LFDWLSDGPGDTDEPGWLDPRPVS